MTSENGTTPTVYTMRLDFDVRQVSTALRFNLLGNEGSDPTGVEPNGTPAMQPSGVAAGGYQLQNGDGINVVIFAYYDPTTTSAIAIKGLTLVALPAPYSADCPLPANEQLYLSPCDANYATCHINIWQPNGDPVSASAVSNPTSTTVQAFTTQQAFNPPQQSSLGSTQGDMNTTDSSMSTGDASNLTVSAPSGLWQIMGFLSVVVTSIKSVQTHRVYTFDPDLMVGGVLPPQPPLPSTSASH
ncbi:hypothetical protein [Nitrospirillum pindoramense]|uniref:Uncharacterized protein n=1 Tax=Nitrospirillum amazonense TaxID=28077 RepID=A0A560GU21_9PROT|nr:hypothetical protein [Nitrospirillum amazonense]TWB37527.1 hypothetical protein FBZ90_11412 [Nitrospirillum amazonense]